MRIEDGSLSKTRQLSRRNFLQQLTTTDFPGFSCERCADVVIVGFQHRSDTDGSSKDCVKDCASWQLAGRVAAQRLPTKAARLPSYAQRKR